MNFAYVLALLASTALLPASAQAGGPLDPTKGCKSNPEVVAPCFALRGRVFAANGAWPMRIWPVGSKRYLGVLPPEDEIAPQAIKDQFSWDKNIYADLVVCPFTEQRAGQIQFVCIESAHNLRIESNVR